MLDILPRRFSRAEFSGSDRAGAAFGAGHAVVFTANANNSDEIKKELVLAGRHRVSVVPIRVEDVTPSDAVAYELATRQWIDLYSDWEKEIERLAVRIGQILQTGKPPDADGADAATVAGARRRIGAGRRLGPGIVVAISALVAVLLVTGAALLYLRPFARPPSAAAPAHSRRPPRRRRPRPRRPRNRPHRRRSPSRPPRRLHLHRPHHHPRHRHPRRRRRRRRPSHPQRRQAAARRRNRLRPQHSVPMTPHGRRRRRRTRLPRSTII